MAAITIRADPDGTFKGAAPEIGCHFLGLANPAIGIPGTLRLDVAASDCRIPAFDARYQGHLILEPHGTAIFQLSAVYMQSLASTVVAEFKGTLRR